MNAGNILDYLLTTFSIVIVFCFNFHKLGAGQDPSMVTVYKNKKIVSTFPLYQNPTPAHLVFILLPLRSLIIFFQIIIHSLRLKMTYGSFDYFFSVNAFSAWCGNILRYLGVVKKTYFWIWDYYPPNKSDPIVRTMRWLYWQFDKYATTTSNEVVFLNQRLALLKERNGISLKKPIKSIGIGTNPINKRINKQNKITTLVFFGVVKKRHGIDLLFDSIPILERKLQKCSISIIGGGPDLNYYKQKSIQYSLPITFHGYIKNENDVDTLIQQADIGIATYTNDESNVSQYTDPSKIKRYISNGLPVIATDVFEFSKIIKTHHAGIITKYNEEDFVNSIKIITHNYKSYKKSAIKLAQKYSYKIIYKNFFI